MSVYLFKFFLEYWQSMKNKYVHVYDIKAKTRDKNVRLYKRAAFNMTLPANI